MSGAERVAYYRAAKGAASDAVWPVPRPIAGTDADATEARKVEYRRAILRAEAMLDTYCQHIANGVSVTVVVESGARVNTVRDGDTVVSWANVPGAEFLAELCSVATHVEVAIDAEDPRDWEQDDYVNEKMREKRERVLTADSNGESVETF
jgi:hypothetical protein